MGSKNLSSFVLCGNLVVTHLTASIREKAQTILTYVEVDHAMQMVNYYVSESTVIFDFARNSKEVERRREWRHVSPVRVYFASNECSDLRSLILQGGMLFRVNGHTDRIIIRYQAQWPRLSVILSKFLSTT